MPQLNSDDGAANDEPTAYNVEDDEDDQRWSENLSDIKVDLVEELDKDRRGGSSNKSSSHGESSSKDRIERDDPREEVKVPGRPYLYPPDIGSIVSSLPSFFQNGGLPPNSKVPYPYHPYHHLLYGPPPGGDIDSKTGMARPHHPDIPAMYSLPGQLGQIPHPLAPWSTPPLYPICTASTICNTMLRYPNPFAAFTSAAAAAASSMPRFPHGPGMHPTMIPHPALVSNGPLGNMGNGQHPHHGKHDDKPGGRHSKDSESGGRSKRDRPYVKKPLNAFMLYMKEQRAKVVAECTLKESAAINQILGRKWHSLSREEQQKYYEMARKERQLHLQLYPGWSARDNYGKRKKRKKEKNQGECTDSPLPRDRPYASLASERFYHSPSRPGSSSSIYYGLGGLSHFSGNYGRHNSNNNNNNNNNNNSVPQCNSSFPQCDFLHDSADMEIDESSSLGSQEMRRKKKCIRYQHDDDSSDDDLSPMNSPQPYQGYPNQPHPFDSMRTTSPPLSMTSQSLSSTNSDFNVSTATSSSSRPPNHVSPNQIAAVIPEGNEMPEIKQEFRTSPVGMDGQIGMRNGRGFEQFGGRHPGRNSSSDNSFKSEGSPHSQGGDSNNSHGNHHHGNNENNNNSKSGKEHPHQRQNFNRGIPSNGVNNPNPQNSVHRQASAPPGGGSGENRSSFRKTNSLDSSDMPGPSGLSHRRNSDMPSHNASGHSSDHSPGSRTHHRSSSSFSKPNGPSSSSHLPHPSPIHPQSGGLYLPSHTGNSPLLPVSPPYNHSPHGGHFMHPISPYLPAALAAFGAPPSPLGNPMLSLFKGISPSSIGGGMGGPNPGSSHTGHSRGNPSAVVEGKS